MSKHPTLQERQDHAERLKLADQKWAELRADEHYENADPDGIGKWYWTAGFVHGLRHAQSDIDTLREAIRRLAAQDATLSVQGGNVIVEMDATLTDEEREAIAGVLTGRDHLVIHDVWKDEWKQNCDTLRGLLERTGGGR